MEGEDRIEEGVRKRTIDGRKYGQRRAREGVRKKMR
jgi:hypothetical protein